MSRPFPLNPYPHGKEPPDIPEYYEEDEEED